MTAAIADTWRETDVADVASAARFADEAGRRLAQDLFDALWMENPHGFRERARWSAEAAPASLAVPLDDGRVLVWRGRRVEGWRPLRLAPEQAVTLVGEADASAVPLDAAATLDHLQSAAWWPALARPLGGLLRDARRQFARTLAAEARWLARLDAAPRALLAWEALCCLRDRPFHPFARAKVWPGEPGDAFDVESGQPVTWHWLAVPRGRVIAGTAGGLEGADDAERQPCAHALLDAHEFATLAYRAREAGADADALWLPVHPWQIAQLRRRQPALLDGCVDLGAGPGTGTPTASLRSLGVARAPSLHLKLALGVQALGAERVLPPRYQHNGELAQRCLRTLAERDRWLGAHLRWCDEGAWWVHGATPAPHDEATLIAERGDLGCLLRRYPDADGDNWLLPMAALAVCTSDGRLPALDAAAGARPASREARSATFARIAGLVIELGLRCLRYGVMPELHGQNVVLRIGADGATGIVLRDHDTLRICPARMREAGIATPDYVIDRGSPNMLILDDPLELLAYFQTLAVGVNLYAILAALADVDTDGDEGDGEAAGWRIVHDVLRENVARVFDESDGADASTTALGARVAEALFERDAWPFKQLVMPLAGRASVGTGMPSGLGAIGNPLHLAAARADAPR